MSLVVLADGSANNACKIVLITLDSPQSTRREHEDRYTDARECMIDVFSIDPPRPGAIMLYAE